MAKKSIEKDKFNIRVEYQTKAEKRRVMRGDIICLILLVCSCIFTPIYLKSTGFGEIILHIGYGFLGMMGMILLFKVILWMINPTKCGKDKEISEYQAVYVIKGIKKGFVGVVEEKRHYYPDSWTCKYGYGLFVNGAAHLVDKDCVECFNTFVETDHVVACLCKKCNMPLVYTHDFVFFKCKGCGDKVKITNQSHPKYEEGEITNLRIQAKEVMRKAEEAIKKCKKQ